MDYFDARNSDYNLDLADAMGQFRDRPTLHQAATLSGIPGKLEVSGASVSQMWLDGKLAEIVEYNECDAFTTHLLWARVAHFSGLLSTEKYLAEQNWSVTYWNLKFHKTAPICNAFYRSGIVYSL